MCRCLKQQHGDNTQDIKQIIDLWNIDLPFINRGILKFQRGPEVQMHRFTKDGKATTDERLACNDGRSGSHDNAGNKQPIGHHGIKRIHARVYTVEMSYDISPLPHIIQDEHGLNKQPTDGDIATATVPQIRIKRLSTRRTKEHCTEN